MTNPYLSADLHNLATTWAMVAPRVDTKILHRGMHEVWQGLTGSTRTRPAVVWCANTHSDYALWANVLEARLLRVSADHEILTAIVSPNDTVTVVPASEALKVLRESEAEQQA
jgi:hypothetical protein